jgi:perosamine synthetase
MSLRIHPRLTLDIGWSDLWFAMTSGAFSNERWAGQVDTNLAALAKAFPGRPILATLSVRSAFLAMLRSLDALEGSEVLMSAVNIENMADVVRAAGFKPVPVDIDLDTLAPTPDAVRAAITPRTVLYLHAHLYGSRNPLAAFAAICRARNVLLVEDCAQAYDGRAFLGSSEADASLFSFGPIKPATTLGGAIVRLRDPTLHARMQAHMQSWPVQDPKSVPRRARKLATLKALSGPSLYAAAIAAMKFRKLDVDTVIGAAARGFKPGDLITQLSHQPSPRLLAVMARRLASHPRASWRRDNAIRIRAALTPAIFTPGWRAADHAFWLYPIIVQNSAELIDALRREGFDATRGATSMRVIAGAHTPRADQLIRDVVYLPLSPRFSAREIARMAAIVSRVAAVPQARAA